ncbi:hypothetical protein ACFQ2B_40880 [Streptomyces stramineus]|uniref:hypothetical protein n=1 Tax=Streptomyces TaxID=1883 RepID=UPI0031DC32C2
MTLTTECTTGDELAENLLRGIGNEQMRAATRLLGAHRDGYWLRRFLDDRELAEAVNQPCQFIDRADTSPSVDWNAVALVLVTQPWVLKCSGSEQAVLEFAASLVGKTSVNLHKAINAADEDEFERMLRAMRQAAYGDVA